MVQQWDYEFIDLDWQFLTVGRGDPPEPNRENRERLRKGFYEQMRDLSAKGWEPVGQVELTVMDQNDRYLMFKRPKTWEADRWRELGLSPE